MANIHSFHIASKPKTVSGDPDASRILTELHCRDFYVEETRGPADEPGEYPDRDTACRSAEMMTIRHYGECRRALERRMDALGEERPYPYVAAFMKAVLPQSLEPSWAQRKVGEYNALRRLERAWGCLVPVL